MPGERGLLSGRRVAVVGCGGAGQAHLAALERAGVAPAVLVDPDPARSAELGRRWPEAVRVPSVAAVGDLGAVADLAIVAVPDRAHATVAVDLLGRGLDVLVEKPMAGTRREATAMVEAATAAGRTLAVAHVRRHLSVKRWAHDLLRSGQLGAVVRVDAAQGGTDDWVASSGGYVLDAAGGVVADQGAHGLDLLTWWFGPLEVVSCSHDARGGHEAEATIELRAGTVPLRLELSRLRPMRNTIRVHTERGVLEVALDHYQPQQLVAVPAGVATPPFTAGADALADQFDRQLEALSSALGGRWPATLATAAEGAAVVGAIEDCYARAPRPVPAAVAASPSGGVPRPLAVLGATGVLGGRFVELAAADHRTPVRAIVHRWWHTARIARFPVALRDAGEADVVPTAAGVAAAVDGCGAAVSFVDGPTAGAATAEAIVAGCARAGLGRLVHVGCLGSYGAVASGRLDEDVDPTEPPGVDAARRWAFEQALLAAGRSVGLDVVVVAVPLVYGPHARGGTVRLHAQVARGRVALAEGSGRCHVIAVDDAVAAARAALAAPGPLAGRIFATGPAATTWVELYRGFERIVGRPGVAVLPDAELAALVAEAAAGAPEPRWPPVPGAGRRVVGAVARRVRPGAAAVTPRRRLLLPDAHELAARFADVEVPIGRAASLLGWTPTVDLDEGLRRAEAYLRWVDPR